MCDDSISCKFIFSSQGFQLLKFEKKVFVIKMHHWWKLTAPVSGVGRNLSKNDDEFETSRTLSFRWMGTDIRSGSIFGMELDRTFWCTISQCVFRSFALYHLSFSISIIFSSIPLPIFGIQIEICHWWGRRRFSGDAEYDVVDVCTKFPGTFHPEADLRLFVTWYIMLQKSLEHSKNLGWLWLVQSATHCKWTGRKAWVWGVWINWSTITCTPKQCGLHLDMNIHFSLCWLRSVHCTTSSIHSTCQNMGQFGNKQSFTLWKNVKFWKERDCKDPLVSTKLLSIHVFWKNNLMEREVFVACRSEKPFYA